jgi:hypothetical protein
VGSRDPVLTGSERVKQHPYWAYSQSSELVSDVIIVYEKFTSVLLIDGGFKPCFTLDFLKQTDSVIDL